MTPDQTETILKRQESDWPWRVAEAKKGNPFTTLCGHCYGRHRPPMNEICPYDPPLPKVSDE